MNLCSARGFTLVETLLVCALAGILLTAAFPVYSITVDNTRLKKATSQLVADLRQAQILAQREGYRTRVTFDRASRSYEVQLAQNASVTAGCQPTTDFKTVRSGQLKDYQVRLSGTGMDCVVYEPSGRVVGGFPLIERVDSATDTAEQGTRSWVMYTDGRSANVGDSPDPNVMNNVITWIFKSEVFVTLDLGRPEFLRSVCAQVIESQNDGVPFPLEVRLDYSDIDSSIPPSRYSPNWKTDPGFVIKTYPVKEPLADNQSADGMWRRSCPEFSPNLTARHIRFVFAVDTSALALAIDEVFVDIPLSVTLENDNGRGTKTVTVTPVTGRVTIQ